jgi:hypothetical protein
VDGGSGADAARLAAIRDVLASPSGRQHDALAHNVVEFGPSLASSLRMVAADPVAAGFREADQELLAALAGQAAGLLTAWLTGGRITARADEGERRVLVLKRVVAEDPGDSLRARQFDVADDAGPMTPGCSTDPSATMSRLAARTPGRDGLGRIPASQLACAWM